MSNFLDEVRNRNSVYLNQAENWAGQQGYDPGGTNAFAHAYGSARFTSDYGQSGSYFLGQGREIKTFAENMWNDDHRFSWDTYRDLWNNEFGRKVGQLYNDGVIDMGQIYTIIDAAVRDGSLILYNDDPRIPAWIKGNPYPPGFFKFGGLQRVPDPKLPSNEHCFLAGTPIDMWPVDTVGLVADEDGDFDQEAVKADIWQKPIEDVSPDDWVVSFTSDGRLKPGRVKRTFQNRSKHILDMPVPNFDSNGEPDGSFGSLMMTPGHATYCASVPGEESPFGGQYVPIMDILRVDGALKMQDGTLVRASTGAVVGSEDDQQVWAHLFERAADGSKQLKDKKLIRLGTCWIQSDGQTISVREYMDSIGVELIQDGKFRGHTCLKGSGPVTPFEWVLSDHLPKPEDYVLQRSAVSLEEIYAANEWEGIGPKMPSPFSGEAGRSFHLGAGMHPNGGVVASDHMPRNVPLSMRGTGAEHTEVAPQGPTSDGKAMSRKQRRAQETKMRKDARSKQRKSKTLH